MQMLGGYVSLNKLVTIYSLIEEDDEDARMSSKSLTEFVDFIKSKDLAIGIHTDNEYAFLITVRRTSADIDASNVEMFSTLGITDELLDQMALALEQIKN